MLALVTAIPATVAAQTQGVPVDNKAREAPQHSTVEGKAVALQNARAQAALEKRVLSLEQQVAALEADEAGLQKQLLALQQTLATIQATALPVQRQGANYIVTVPAGLTLHASGVTIEGDATMTLKASGSVAINAGTADIAATHIGLDAPNIGLNAAKNGQAAVRAGDTAVCATPGNCRVIAGSTSVFIGN